MQNFLNTKRYDSKINLNNNNKKKNNNNNFKFSVKKARVNFLTVFRNCNIRNVSAQIMK